MSEAEHRFGGAWTERKLQAVSYYLAFYTNALKGREDASYRFSLWYIDAFAGSGERTKSAEVGGLLDGTPVKQVEVQLDGSAKRAMAVQPPFKHLVFIEDDGPRFLALSALRKIDDRVRCIQGDANVILPEIFNGPEWRLKPSQTGKGTQRGVVFLDPYGMQVRWETLKALADTRRVDVWFLFPLEAIGRQLAHNLSAVDQWKQARLDAVFGGPEWRDELYAQQSAPGLFGDAPIDKNRKVSKAEIEAYFAKKLDGIFSYVSPPLPLGEGARQQFSLFLLVANDSHAAVNLARNAMKDLVKRHTLAASRQRSGL